MKPEKTIPRRPWKGVIFHCCGVYGRVYQDPVTHKWSGFCPRCGRQTMLSLLLLLLVFLFGFTPHVNAQDSSGVALFIQPGIQFLGFDDRNRFQTELDSHYVQLRRYAGDDSTNVTKQDYQKVNFAFPVYAGVQWHVRSHHSVAAGMGYIYDREAVVLSDGELQLQERYYTLQAIPAFIEYRLSISPHLIRLRDKDQFSILARWYWFLPGTEIYSSSGHVKANSDWTGNGWGVSLGYHLGSWRRLSLFGDLGFSSLRVHSDQTWDQVVQHSSPDKASWELGGIQMQIRASFGAIR